VGVRGAGMGLQRFSNDHRAVKMVILGVVA